jgi:hypothetical protein
MSAHRTDTPEDQMTRTEKFTVALFSLFSVLIIVPALVFSAIAIISPGAIDLGH